VNHKNESAKQPLATHQLVITSKTRKHPTTTLVPWLLLIVVGTGVTSILGSCTGITSGLGIGTSFTGDFGIGTSVASVLSIGAGVASVFRLATGGGRSSGVAGCSGVATVVTSNSTVVAGIARAVAAEYVGTTALTNAEVYTIIQEAMLRDGNENRGMIRIRVDRAAPVDTRGKTTCDCVRHNTVDGSCIDPLEMCKGGGV